MRALVAGALSTSWIHFVLVALVDELTGREDLPERRPQASNSGSGSCLETAGSAYYNLSKDSAYSTSVAIG